VDEQVFRFKDTVRVVGRHPRPVLLIALIGLVLGLLYGIAVPALVSAKTMVVLPPQAAAYSGAPTRDVQTEIAIAMSSSVLVPASIDAGEKLPFLTIQKRVSITAVTDELLQISAKASTASQAEQLANAVAAEFVSYSAGQASLYQSGQVAEWKTQATDIQSQITNISRELVSEQKVIESEAPTAPDYDSQQSSIDALSAAQSNFGLELRVVNTQIAQAELSASTPGSNVIILQRATTAVLPSITRIPQLGAVGLVLGFLIGIIVSFAVGRRDRRIRLRDDFSRAAGVPVVASVSASSRNIGKDLLGILEHFDPTVSDKANLRRLLDELAVPRRALDADTPHSHNGSSWHGEGVDLSAIVIAGDSEAVVVVAELAAFAANQRLPVALIVGTTSPSTEQLAIACAARDPLGLGAARPNLLTYASAPDVAPSAVALAVTLDVVKPSKLDVSDTKPPTASPERRSCTVLVVSPGRATPEDIQVVALAAEHQGRPLDGVVVAGPEPSDKTSGQSVRLRATGAQTPPRQITALRSTAR